MSRLDELTGPYIRIQDEGYEGLSGKSFPTLKEAVEAQTYSAGPFIVVKLVKYDVVEDPE
jgi:hypothetical protein